MADTVDVNEGMWEGVEAGRAFDSKLAVWSRVLTMSKLSGPMIRVRLRNFRRRRNSTGNLRVGYQGREGSRETSGEQNPRNFTFAHRRMRRCRFVCIDHD